MNRLLALLAAAALVGCDEKKSAPTEAASFPSASVSAIPVGAGSSPPALPATTKTVAAPPTSVAAQHVLVAFKGAKGATKSVVRSKADAKKRAEEVAAKAKSGADFTALVAEYSDDPGSKDRLGSVGKFTREKMTKAFSDAAFALDVDAISDVVETDFGFHVIKRNQ